MPENLIVGTDFGGEYSAPAVGNTTVGLGGPAGAAAVRLGADRGGVFVGPCPGGANSGGPERVSADLSGWAGRGVDPESACALGGLFSGLRVSQGF